jgi:hypothetical protein
MVSNEVTSSDLIVVKMEPFHKDWAAMMASDDLSQCIPIIEKAKEYFRGRKNTLQVARSVFKKAFQRHLLEMREDAVLGAYGLTMDEFLRSGKRRFTERKFDSLCDQMNQIDPKCEFIVHGFDGLQVPHIFHVGGAGTDGVLDKPGFCAIGSGRWAAEVVLYSLGQSVDRTLTETIFNVCAAKFTAENAIGVGQHTFLYARKPGSEFFSHGRGMIEAIRQDWEENGRPRVPAGAAGRIANFGVQFGPEA